MNILEDFYNPVVLHPEHSYSASGIYHQIQPTYDLNVSLPPKGLEQVDRMEGLTHLIVRAAGQARDLECGVQA